MNARAILTCATVAVMYKGKYLRVFADPDDGDFADNVFMHVFTKIRMKYNLLLVTQDRSLASEAMRLGKDNRAVHGMKKIIAQRLDKNGFLKKFPDNRTVKAAAPVSKCGRFDVQSLPRFP